MDQNHFINKVKACLLLDLILILSIPFFGYLSLAGFLLFTPLKMVEAAGGAIAWLRDSHPRRCTWWAMGRAMSGSGLLFLLSTLVLQIWPSPETGDIWEQLLFFFVVLGVYRGLGAAYLNILVAPVVAVKGKDSITKLDSLAAFLCSGSGLYIWQNVLSSSLAKPAFLSVLEEGAPDYTVYAFLAAYFTISFLNGLALGGALHWAVSRLKQQDPNA